MKPTSMRSAGRRRRAPLVLLLTASATGAAWAAPAAAPGSRSDGAMGDAGPGAQAVEVAAEPTR